MGTDLQVGIAEIWESLEQVSDPEIPVLSIVDLGIVRQVSMLPNNVPKITITPTYSGCPAMKVIEEDIEGALKFCGYHHIEIEKVLKPAWTTDWLSEKGIEKLQAYGIAPPQKSTIDSRVLFSDPKEITCPKCKSKNTEMTSRFGSTPCKSLYVCKECLEPFDYFKCI